MGERAAHRDPPAWPSRITPGRLSWPGRYRLRPGAVIPWGPHGAGRWLRSRVRLFHAAADSTGPAAGLTAWPRIVSAAALL